VPHRFDIQKSPQGGLRAPVSDSGQVVAHAVEHPERLDSPRHYGLLASAGRKANVAGSAGAGTASNCRA
jgi:hypothetical protein